MFWIFSSWCVKGELGLWDSRLGTPRGRSSRETEEIERLIWYSSYAAMSVLGVDSLRGGGGRLEQIHTQHRHHICAQYRRDKSIFYLFICLFINLYACAEMHLIWLTCDLPNGAEYIEFFWVQSFNVVIDIPVNDNGRSEHQKQKQKGHSICIFHCR